MPLKVLISPFPGVPLAEGQVFQMQSECFHWQQQLNVSSLYLKRALCDIQKAMTLQRVWFTVSFLFNFLCALLFLKIPFSFLYHKFFTERVVRHLKGLAKKSCGTLEVFKVRLTHELSNLTY